MDVNRERTINSVTSLEKHHNYPPTPTKPGMSTAGGVCKTTVWFTHEKLLQSAADGLRKA